MQSNPINNEVFVNNNQPMRKNPEDICSGGNAAIFNEILHDSQHFVHVQEKQGRKKRIREYSELLSCRLINIEIQPFEVPPDRALLTIRTAAGYHRKDVQVAECFALIDFLQDNGFNTLSTSKIRRERNQRENEDRVFTLFILGKENAQTQDNLYLVEF